MACWKQEFFIKQQTERLQTRARRPAQQNSDDGALQCAQVRSIERMMIFMRLTSFNATEGVSHQLGIKHAWSCKTVAEGESNQPERLGEHLLVLEAFCNINYLESVSHWFQAIAKGEPRVTYLQTVCHSLARVCDDMNKRQVFIS